MIELRTTSDEERDEFFEMMRWELRDHEQVAITSLGLTWESLAETFRTVGEVRAVVAADETAGFVWIELRPPTLCVQSMVLALGFRGQGIGTAAFRLLEWEFCEVADAIVVGALTENEPAISFYRRSGFTPTEEEAAPGFENLRRTIAVD